jgi:hypothetical protein
MAGGILTNEIYVLGSLAEAWNAFKALPDHYAGDLEEMARAINACHAQIALRVARRANPEIWRQPTKPCKRCSGAGVHHLAHGDDICTACGGSGLEA